MNIENFKCECLLKEKYLRKVVTNDLDTQPIVY